MIQGLSGHLHTLYPHLGPEQALLQASADGFKAVEMWEAPAEHEQAQFVSTLTALGLELVSLNTTSGSNQDSFGLLGDPTVVGLWRDDFERTLAFARLAGARAINVLAGGRVPHSPWSAQWECLIANLQWALSRLARDDDPFLLLEPLNGADRRSPLLKTPADVLWVLAELDQPHLLKMLFDVYHVFQETEGLLEALHVSAGTIGHVQLADYPGRAEPGTGVIPIADLLRALAETGYEGWLGLEYFPRDSAAAGLDWVRDMPLPTAAQVRQGEASSPAW
jgi:hydroxypyruvate isomerase